MLSLTSVTSPIQMWTFRSTLATAWNNTREDTVYAVFFEGLIFRG